MAPGRLLGCVLVAVLALSAGCGEDKDRDRAPGDETKAPTSADLIARCESLAKACADSEKRVQKVVDECKQAATDQVTSGCTAQAVAAYDCYAKELCGKGEPVWALDDLRVLSERHTKCVAEREATRTCVEN